MAALAPARVLPLTRRSAYWEDEAANSVMESLSCARATVGQVHLNQWRALRDFLDGIHFEHVRLAASIAYPERSQLWNQGDGHAYRYFRLVEMIAERLSVAFHRPPELFLHLGDGEPLDPDDPRYGAQVAQLEQDREDAELDTRLSYLDATVNVMRQAVVQPAFHFDGERSWMTWEIYDPSEVFVDPAASDKSRLSHAKTISIEIREPVQGSYVQGHSKYSTWRRVRLRNGGVAYEHWMHNDGGALLEDPLFGPLGIAPMNPYGVMPLVAWRQQHPSTGRVYTPPDQALLQSQLGIDIGLTDMHHGIKYYAHPMWVQRGEGREETPYLGPDGIAQLDENANLDPKTPDTNLDVVSKVMEWGMRLEALSRSLPPDMFNPSAARNLAALQEQRSDLMMRRERTLPHYTRALKRTWDVHVAVGNFWAGLGAERVPYSPEVRLGVRLAPIPRVEDRWQAAQARQLEIQQNLTSDVEEVMDREGVTRTEAKRRIEAREERKPAAAGAPQAARPPGDIPRPPTVERG